MSSMTLTHPFTGYDQLDESFSSSPYHKGLSSSSLDTRRLIEEYNYKRFGSLTQIWEEKEGIDKKALPKFADLTPYAVILDQETLGSCAANCAAQAIRVVKTIQLINLQPTMSIRDAKRQISTLSRLYTYYYTRQYDSQEGQDLTQEDCGTSIASTLWSLHHQGAPNEEEWPYDIKKFKDMPPRKVNAHAKHNQVLSDFHSEAIKVGHVSEIKSAIAQGYPVLAGIIFNERDYSHGYLKMPIHHKMKLGERHGVTILGYEDHDKTNGYKGHFIAANCWGTKWGIKSYGQGGFFKIPYEFIKDSRLTLELWHITAASLSDIIESPMVNPQFKLEHVDLEFLKYMMVVVHKDISKIENSSLTRKSKSHNVEQLRADYDIILRTLHKLIA
ncbi:MAG: C1 family peptidase [Janthinobacterium lividum]